MDVDTIVQGDLVNLWQTDLSVRALAHTVHIVSLLHVSTADQVKLLDTFI